MTGSTSSFADLRLRVLSALVMILVGVSAIMAGGWVFLVLLSLVAGALFWELLRMLMPDLQPLKALLVAAIAAAAVLRAGVDPNPIALVSLPLAPFLGLVLLRQDRGIFLFYGTALLFAVAGLFWIRNGAGLGWTIWLVLVVVAADIGGYFFGRILGGPKILPVISPKKTWSGTLGGWFLAACVGLGFIYYGQAGWSLVVFSILTAAASQAGDVIESAIKRHSGVKDSSNLIPGHGGFLDRFDALITASLFVVIVDKVIGLPASSMV